MSSEIVKYPLCQAVGLEPHAVYQVMDKKEYLHASYVEAFLAGSESYKKWCNRDHAHAERLVEALKVVAEFIREGVDP